jgi:hypothetical protein
MEPTVVRLTGRSAEFRVVAGDHANDAPRAAAARTLPAQFLGSDMFFINIDKSP